MPGKSPLGLGTPHSHRPVRFESGGVVRMGAEAPYSHLLDLNLVMLLEGVLKSEETRPLGGTGAVCELILSSSIYCSSCESIACPVQQTVSV